jgi:hypothetical protein
VPVSTLPRLSGIGTAIMVLGLIQAAILALVALAAIGWADVGLDVAENQLSLDSVDTWIAAAEIYDFATALEIPVRVALAVLSIIWVHRAYKNLETVGATRLPLSRGMAIGSWFIPIANVFLIPVLFGAVFRAANTSDPTDPYWKNSRGLGTAVSFWVCLVLGLSVVSRIGGALGEAATGEELMAVAVMLLGGSLIAIFGAVLGAMSVRYASVRLDRNW